MIQELCFCLALQPGWGPWSNSGLRGSGRLQRCLSGMELTLNVQVQV